MKKIQFLAIAILAMTVQSVLAQNNRIIRRHNGTVTLYNSSNLNQAIKDCKAGDTISLGKGNYTGFTINKAITVIGNGAENTFISGDVVLGNNSTDNTLKLTNRILDGVKIEGYLSLRNVNLVKIRKCDVSNVTYLSDYYKKDTSELEIESCNIRNCLSNLKNITALNSKIYGIGYPHLNAYFQNCFISRIQTSDFDGYMENCVVGNPYGYTIKKGNWTNCLFVGRKNYVSDFIATYCYFDEQTDPKNITDDYLKTLPYMGTDGTMVGPYGGFEPYSLAKPNPITYVNLKVDDANQKLNVRVKLADQQ